MINNEQDARNRIIKAATEILNEVSDVDKVTVRQIANRANVGIGLINYHFKSKDNLLSIAIGEIMAKMASNFIASDNYIGIEPTAKLKTMLRELYGFAKKHEKLIQFMLTYGILNGDFKTPLFLIPALREIFTNKKNEIELRLIALQIIFPIQVTAINPSAFYLYSGIDLHNTEQRNRYIDTLVDNLVR